MAQVGVGDGGGCGCKGIRSCLLCEDGVRKGSPPPPVTRQKKQFIFNPKESVAVRLESTEYSGWAFEFPGVYLIEDFVTENEERELVCLMDQEEWKSSQSGRLKQDFGPKVNFKKRKLKVGNFTGLPSFSQVLWQRMKQHTVLEGFQPVEQCNLDYNSERGSAIDPHLDDSWLWGERLVTLNLLSSTVLTMTCDSLSSVQLMPIESHGAEPNNITHFKPPYCNSTELTHSAFQGNAARDKLHYKTIHLNDVEVAIYLPPRSLIVLYGDARHRWKHAILREHITQRRVCSTFRELSAEYHLGGKEENIGQMLLQTALGFQGKSV